MNQRLTERERTQEEKRYVRLAQKKTGLSEAAIISLMLKYAAQKDGLNLKD